MFEYKVLRRIFGPKREEVAGGWRILHNEELNNFYASPNIIRVIKEDEMDGACRVMDGEDEKCKPILIRKCEGMRSLRRPRRRWDDNIRLDVRKVEWEGVDWIYLSQHRVHWRDPVNTIMNLRVP
jgi:hypothetical protein